MILLFLIFVGLCSTSNHRCIQISLSLDRLDTHSHQLPPVRNPGTASTNSKYFINLVEKSLTNCQVNVSLSNMIIRNDTAEYLHKLLAEQSFFSSSFTIFSIKKSTIAEKWLDDTMSMPIRNSGISYELICNIFGSLNSSCFCFQRKNYRVWSHWSSDNKLL